MSDSYFEQVLEICNIDASKVDQISNLIIDSIVNGKSIWIMGNGGSASTANHLETDLSYARTNIKLPKIKAFSLASNSSLISAIANDIGFDRIFQHQLFRKANEGDLCILISASGNSFNLVNAALFARGSNIRTVALLGFDGGKLRALADYSLVVESPQGMYGPVEDIHSALCHAISAQVLRKLSNRV